MSVVRQNSWPPGRIAWEKGGLCVNALDREIGLVLLKRLWKRELISEEAYRAACNAPCFDQKRFASDYQTEGQGGRDDH